MALRCLNRLKYVNQIVSRSSCAASSIQLQHNIVNLRRTDDFQHCMINNIQVRHFAYKKKQSSSSKQEEVSFISYLTR
jgi:hypothetical protein